jgi:hypothetical protein
MDISEIITYALDHIIPVILGAFILFLILRRLYKTARQHMGMRSYLKSAEKLDKKKFNGIHIVDSIQRKRKRHTNSFKQLRGRAKKKVRQYLTHKSEELPVVVRYAKGKMFKRSRSRLIITITNGRKTLQKASFKKGIKELIDITNEYECVDEMITFLHYLPQALLKHEEYDIYVDDADVAISYYIK